VKPNHFTSIESKSQGDYKEKGSKFLAFAHPLSHETDAKVLLDLYKKEYYDARHICYAYVFGTESEVMKSSDAGEPNGSAGLPILNQLRSFEVKNVFLVVVRYFGGTKLGVSGLVSAYKSAAKQALENATLVEVPIKVEVEIRFAYDKMNTIMKWLKEWHATPLEQVFHDQECAMKVKVLRSYEKVLLEKMDEWR
jgi:uncharacterized YigZ family protein